MLNLHRQLDLIDSKLLETPVIVIGAGGIGSTLTLCLAKMGFTKVTVYDDDSVEDHNIPNQMYPLDSIGHPKVSALGVNCQNFAELEITQKYARYDGEVAPIIISGVDSMKSRQEIWSMIKRNINVKLYVDARMGAENFSIYALKPYASDDIKRYEKTLHSDEEGMELPCTARAIIYNTFILAGFIANRVTNHLRGKDTWHEMIADINGPDILIV